MNKGEEVTWEKRRRGKSLRTNPDRKKGLRKKRKLGGGRIRLYFSWFGGVKLLGAR